MTLSLVDCDVCVCVCVCVTFQVLGDRVSEAIAKTGEDASIAEQTSTLKIAFSQLMSADPELVSDQLQSLVERVTACPPDCRLCVCVCVCV